jgi:RNA polymerase sigma-70 factor (ECF subfamily)
MTREREPDEQLMRKVQAGDLAAFERLVDRFKSAVYRFAYSMLRTPEDAEEAAQDTFIKLFRRRDLFDTQRALEPWLLRIAGNTCRDLLRRRRTAQLPIARDPDGGSLVHLLTDERDTEQGQWTGQAVRHALEQLSDRHRLPLLLKYEQQMTNQQIADALGISVSNVKVRVARAKEVLQSRLDRVVGG